MYSRQQESITSQFHSRLEAVFNHIWKIVLVFWPLIHFVFCPGSFRACCILWGVPVVEDGVDTYRCLFLISQSQYCHIGYGMFSHWHLLHICSFSSQLYSKTLHKLYTICFWNHSVSPISLLCTPCVYFFMLCLLYMQVMYLIFLVWMWQLFLNDNTRRMYMLCWSARSPLPGAIRGHAVYYRRWHFYFQLP